MEVLQKLDLQIEEEDGKIVILTFIKEKRKK